MKDSITLKPKRKKPSASNPNEELELLRKYGYNSFHLTTNQYLKKLSLSVSNFAGGMRNLKKGVTS